MLDAEQSGRVETVRAAPDRGGYVLPVVGIIGLSCDLLEDFGREDLDVEPVWIGSRLEVACVYTLGVALEQADHVVDNDRIDQRAVTRHPRERSGMSCGCANEAGEDVVAWAAVHVARDLSSHVLDRVVGCLGTSRDDDALDLGSPLESTKEEGQEWLSSDIGGRFAGEARRGHPRLHDREHSRHTLMVGLG